MQIDKLRTSKRYEVARDLFSEEDKNTIPFVRAVYKKIRNVAKKLT
jgi:hypothetical protein